MKIKLDIVIGNDDIRVYLPDETYYEVSSDEYTLLREVVRKAIQAELEKLEKLLETVIPPEGIKSNPDYNVSLGLSEKD